MYIRIIDDNEAMGSEHLFRNKAEVIKWLNDIGDPDAAKEFAVKGQLDGQMSDNGAYHYIAKIEFEYATAVPEKPKSLTDQLLEGL